MKIKGIYKSTITILGVMGSLILLISFFAFNGIVVDIVGDNSKILFYIFSPLIYTVIIIGVFQFVAAIIKSSSVKYKMIFSLGIKIRYYLQGVVISLIISFTYVHLYDHTIKNYWYYHLIKLFLIILAPTLLGLVDSFKEIGKMSDKEIAAFIEDHYREKREAEKKDRYEM